MTFAAFVMFCLGMGMETVMLHHKRRMAYFNHYMLGLVALAALVVILSVILNAADTIVSLDDDIIGYMFVGIGLYVLAMGVVSIRLLPRITEQMILTVHLLVIFNLITGDNPPFDWQVGVAIFTPTSLALLLITFHKRPLHDVKKALLYLWYLILLLMLAQQNSALETFSKPEINLLEAITTGAIFIFLLLHGLFFLRFFLIVSSLIMPRNRALIRPLMDALFTDEQVDITQMMLVIVGVGVMVGINSLAGIVANQIIWNAAVLLVIHRLFGFAPRAL